ncbi:calcium/calmodulin-dependent protein kinase I [[Candida] anglica]|uniref:Calcium/calmodulin-dependent protein kinase I n=1 Tax=[Candida] anglica TaxID=148631 RepID=A0ABP0E6X9_9ASCO
MTEISQSSISNDKELELQPCKYTLKKRVIGTGSYSSVFEAKNKVTGMHYAIKQYSKKMVYGMEDMLLSELHVLKKISRSHPNILTLVDHFETSQNLYLVTDLARGGELFDRIVNGPNQRVSEQETIETIRTLLSAVEYLHSNRIIHRDLKAENLLYQSKSSRSSNILVADFGLARILKNGEKLHDLSGTLSYMAPEILDRSKGHSFEVDLWAVGVITYFMLCGYMPFDCETDDETMEAIKIADYRYDPPEYWDHISSNAKDFIDKCFIVDPKERITDSQALKHPFLQNKISNSSPQKRSMLDRTSSSTSISASLRESLEGLGLPCMAQPMHSARSVSDSNSATISSVSSKLSLIERSRFASLTEGSTLQGAYCETPDILSTFNSPIHSEDGSRQTSATNLNGLVLKSGGLEIETTKSKPSFVFN